MENSYANSPTTHRHYATYASLRPSSGDKTRENDRNGHDKSKKDSKKDSKTSILTLLGKLSKSGSSSRSQSPFPSPSPYSSSSAPPQPGSTTTPRLSSPLSPPTSTSLASINLKPAEYVRRIKRLLLHPRKVPPSPLSTSSHPSSPKQAIERNNMQHDIIASADNDLRRSRPILPTQTPINTTTASPNHPNIIHNKNNNNNNNKNDDDNNNNDDITNNEIPTQNQPRSSPPSPLLPPLLQPSLLANPSTTSSKENRFLKTFLRSSPPRSNTPLTQFNIATLQAELDGRTGVAGFGTRDVSKPNPLGGDDYDELLELGRSARAVGRLDEEQNRSREKLVCGVERWLGGVVERGLVC
ncbi:hypothetical protein AJ78_08274 [Emergomyces pasteurianus Ep9510]|uniref:Uncharacterized protein n=1 Tax=Emergomyces pasteurianus Ep9510 TaxID=1447872 RepID=A0A1J9Q3F7_9EURO|nr:hypothetical protein AJ78_08274 [Emergomyces pasteurianus Ep9510]